MKSIANFSRIKKQILAASVDTIFLPLIFICAISLRYERIDIALLNQYLAIIYAVPFVSIPVFIRTGLYRAVIRFVDQRIFVAVVGGVALSLLLLATVAVFTHTGTVSRGVFVIYFIGAVLYILTSRFLARAYIRSATRPKNIIHVAIYGAGRAGRQLASALRAGHEYLPVAFVDDKTELQKSTISGVKVWSPEDLPNLIKKFNVQAVLLAMPSVDKARQRAILGQLEHLKVSVKIIPPIASLLSGELRLQDVRDIQIEDLLGRDSVAPEPELLERCITGKSVMVTGAGGSIGSELCRQIIRLAPRRLVLFELSEFALYSIDQELHAISKNLKHSVEVVPFLGSVLEGEKCTLIMSAFEVETVYHAAAYKHVPLVEHNPIDGIRNNVLGTLRVAQAAIATGVACFVLVSTDKAVRPTNAMGASKRMAELILQAFAKEQLGTRFTMVRFGNVLGSSGSVVPLFRKQIMDGGPITVTHPEITRYFMTIPEAAQLVLQAGAMGNGGDVFVLDMGEPVKIVDLAKRMVHLSGLELKSESDSDIGIDIVHVGLRPGEKLFEELLIGDGAEGTSHPLIMRAQEAELPWGVLQDLLVHIEIACDQFDFEMALSLLATAVQEYKPQIAQKDLLWHAIEKSKSSKLRAVS